MKNELPRNVTYYLGAGASFHALPVVNEMQQTVQRLAGNIGATKPKKDFYSELARNLIWLSELQVKYYSIDTATKVFYHSEGSNSKNLKRLKNIVSLYFILEQLECRDLNWDSSKKDPIDDRYFRLLAYYLGDRHIPTLPSNLNFISWNYDMQLELAYNHFSRNSKLSSSIEEFNVLPRVSDFPIDIEEGQVIHLNGIAGLSIIPDQDVKKTHNLIGDIDCASKESILEEIESRDILNTYDHHYTLNFAWEREKISADYPERAKQIMAETEDLVVIGYSFPNFNRTLDTQLIKALRENGKSPRIYYQDVNDNSQIMQSLFNLEKVLPITDVKEHFIPPGV